ncbi:dynein regulatory complex subunit 3-like [Lingula anatina]|uniref:Dynein regulatory complex subunit 3 n=1 Tax=Lingula anatina TaxID=7574 RepID=A0A1S3I9V2_LINAN|nr:dynein regulatory complex subunit 3-like [Lingula anatina]XP_013395046.1 dynein regulatory complex subunit 3-like [Lingula anatina]XP_013401618.1 dynein regulatory complex subunit 3-like [Lingula anatina]XP_013401619.1 dynein regulatory complex subunit 3-like [Lingula anatina]|eukprot:XP_013395045.1 dynein regulatory complex subunit 3-like [Lingula anatina]
MSRLYDTVEPSVIDDDMLHKAVEEQGPKEEAGRIAKAEGIDFADVKSLRLDFKNILKIDNLWCFDSLTKLQLDNNIIEKIEGLDTLTNLIWLDLSFNNIEAIEGLEKLTKLQDLTLYNNRISKIENMDCLPDLQVFSIGNNELDELENVIYLRRFKRLKTLNLNGNPFCKVCVQEENPEDGSEAVYTENQDYRPFIIAYLPSLDYLDYRLIDENTRAAANEKYHLAIEELTHNEEVENKKEEERQAKEKEHNLHKAAYVENMDGPALFHAMYTEDAEGQKLADMPGVDEMLVVYKEKYVATCHQIFEYGLQEHERRMEEVNQFWDCIEEAKRENKEMGMKQINQFMEYKKRLFQELTHLTDQQVLDNKITEYNKRLQELWDKLMGLELQLVDQLEEATKDFERNLSDLVSSFIENCQGHISALRDLENIHHEKLLEISIVTLEKVVKNELDEEIPEDLRLLFVDKDTIINAVSSSHDIHLLKIDNREDDIVTRINQWMSQLMTKIHEEEEVKRNRMRVSEINNLIDHLREEMDTLDLQLGYN